MTTTFVTYTLGISTNQRWESAFFFHIWKYSISNIIYYFDNVSFPVLLKIILFINVFIYWLCSVFVAVWAFLDLQPAGATFQLQCMVFSLQWLLLLLNMVSRVCRLSSRGSQTLDHWLQSSGIRAKQLQALWDLSGLGVTPRFLHQQVDSLVLGVFSALFIYFTILYWFCHTLT